MVTKKGTPVKKTKDVNIAANVKDRRESKGRS